MTSGAVAGWWIGAGDAVEDGLELELEQALELGAAFDAVAEAALAEVFDDLRGGGGADVGGEQDGVEVGERGGVDLAGEGDDGADGLGEGLAGAGDRLLHAVEEAELGGVRGRVGLGCWGGGRLGDGGRFGFGGALAEEGEGHVRL